MIRRIRNRIFAGDLAFVLAISSVCVADAYAEEQRDETDYGEFCGAEELEDVRLSDDAAETLLALEQDGTDEVAVQSQNRGDYDCDYLYEQLTDDEKAFYSDMEEECDKFLLTNADAVYEENNEIYVIGSASYEGLDHDAAQKVVYILLYQHPEYYFISSKYAYSSNKALLWLSCYDDFADGDARESVSEKFFDKVDSWIAEIEEETTDYEKELKAHDIVCVNIVYEKNDYDQSAYSAVMLGESVCAGYTKMFSLLMNGAGLDTLGIIGSNHAWNMSCIDGSWYNVDATFDDQSTYISHTYMNRSDSYFKKRHVASVWYDGILPEVPSDYKEIADNNYYPAYVKGIEIGDSTKELEPRDTWDISADTSISPSDAIDTAVVWKSSDTNVARVSMAGVVTAVGVGSATITAVTNNMAKSDTCVVNVSSHYIEELPTEEPTTEQSKEPATTTDATVTASGIYLVNHTKDVICAGLVAKASKTADLEYRWLAMDTSTDTQTWVVIQDWVKNNEWLTWTPESSGDYVIVGQVRVIGNESSQAQADIGIEHHRQIKGKCQMPYTGAGGGYLIGVETYDNPNREYTYELLVLDCTLLAEGKDAWIWTTGRCVVPETSFWAVWQPQYGYYWTLFRVYDADGNMIDQECYPFVNAY